MIVDKIENAHIYFSINSLLGKGLRYILAQNFDEVQPGKTVLEGESLFAMVNEYDTKPAEQCKPEAHRRYTDIQFMVSGEEKIGFTPYNGQTPMEEFNTENDIMFFNLETDQFTFKTGYFAVFFPHDIHQPGIMVDAPSKVRKVVVKVEL